MSKVRNETRKIFNKIYEEKGAQYVEGLGNPVKIDNDVTMIYALHKKNIYECIIDTKDLLKISRGYTYVIHKRNDSDICRVVSALGPLHYCLFKRKHNLVTDHINGNALDNRRCNLRQVTQGINMLNKKQYKSTTACGPHITKLENGYFKVTITRVFKFSANATVSRLEMLDTVNKYSIQDASKRNFS